MGDLLHETCLQGNHGTVAVFSIAKSDMFCHQGGGEGLPYETDGDACRKF